MEGTERKKGKKSEILEGSGEGGGEKKRIWELFIRRELPSSRGEEQKHREKDRAKEERRIKMAVGASLCQCLPAGRELASL